MSRVHPFRASLLLACAAALVPACSTEDDEDIINILAPDSRIVLGVLGRYNTGIYEQSAAEISAFDPTTDRLFVVNAQSNSVDVVDLANPAAPALITSIAFGMNAIPAGQPNSAAVKNGLLAIAVQAPVKTDPGFVLLFASADATFATPLNQVPAGALPDMAAFTPNGNFILVANEGEPNDDYTIDPEGSVTIINVTGGAATATAQTAGFTSFNAQKAALKAAGVRIFGVDVSGLEPDFVATVARDLEPEYIAADDTTAWVTLQENNAFAIVNIATATVTSIVPLGFKDYSLPENAFDPSDRDGPGSTQIFQLVNGPIRGLYMPDAVAAYKVGGQTFLVTANEGDAREYLGTPGLVEEARLGTLALDPTVFPNAAALKANAAFGRLNVTTKTGDLDNDGDLDAIYAFGGRSFTIWSATGQKVWDSGSALEEITAAALPRHFNAGHTTNALDDRSDNKGPEPEGVAVGEIDGRFYAFVILERVGGVVVYDVTNPVAPVFQTYVNTRDFNATPGPGAGAGQPVNGLDLGPEGVVFVPAADSPTGKPLLIVSHEISGSTVIFQVSKLF